MKTFLDKRDSLKDFTALVVLNDIDENEKDLLSFLQDKARQELNRRIDEGIEPKSEYFALMRNLEENCTLLKTILQANSDGSEAEPNLKNYSRLNKSSISAVSAKLYDKFKLSGCVVDINEALSAYQRLALLDLDPEKKVDNNGKRMVNHYSIQFGTIVHEMKYAGTWTPVSGEVPVLWTVYNLQKGVFSLILKGGSLGTGGRMFARNKLKALKSPLPLNRGILLSEDRAGTDRKRLVFTEEEQSRFITARFLFDAERKSKELLENINWALSADFDPEAAGYFYTMTSKAASDKDEAAVYYADRFSSDVYENIWRDEIASVVPVLEIKVDY